MSVPFITLWSQPQLEIERRTVHGSSLLEHTANKQFGGLRVSPGDRVYVVATAQGRILLLGRLIVDRIVDQAEAERHFGHDDIYRAPYHLLGTGTELQLDRVVPESVARQLERESGRVVKIAADEYRVDPQTLRSTGRITDASARLLDGLLGSPVDVVVETEDLIEGTTGNVLRSVVERDSRVRTQALRVHGISCEVCGFSFDEFYGPDIAGGYAEVHHLVPLASTGPVAVNPATDVSVLCANCHRMVHRESPPIPPSELIQAVRARASL